MDEVDQIVLEEVLEEVREEVREMCPITADAVALAIVEPVGVVRRALARLESAGLVDCDDYQQPRGAAKWGPKGWGENP